MPASPGNGTMMNDKKNLVLNKFMKIGFQL